jgi:Sporulation and spore germination
MWTYPRPFSPGRRIATILAAVGLLTALTVACGLPTDERAVPYNVDDLPPGLSQTTTTTTTTTTTSTTTPPTLPGETTTTAQTTTTTTGPAFETKPVTVFYALVSRDELSPLEVQTPVELLGLPAVVEWLESPPRGVGEFNLRTAVPRNLIEEVPFEAPIARVVLNPTILDRMSTAEERRAIAQMVLTFTSFTTRDAGNVGAVTFEVDGEPYEVFVPSEDGTSDPDQLLVFSNFSELIATGSTTATTSTTTTTTVADSDATTSG